MPTLEYHEVLFPKFGVADYHKNSIFGSGVSIYVIDTGLSNTTEKLSNVKNRSMSNSMGPKNTHGSFVSSILAAKKTSKYHGIAPESQIYLADVSDANGSIYTSSLVAAIKDAVDLKVDIISISLGTDVFDESLDRIVRKAASLGILVLAASGNCGCRSYEFPSSCNDAISVASMDINRNPSAFNTKNDFVSVFAPGQNIQIPGSKSRVSGSSFAVPFASGLVALELSKMRLKNPKASLSKVETINYLRRTLGLECDKHTYSNDVCSGTLSLELGNPGRDDGLRWFVILGLFSAILLFFNYFLLYRFSGAKSSTMSKYI